MSIEAIKYICDTIETIAIWWAVAYILVGGKQVIQTIIKKE